MSDSLSTVDSILMDKTYADELRKYIDLKHLQFSNDLASTGLLEWTSRTSHKNYGFGRGKNLAELGLLMEISDVLNDNY